MITPTPIGTKSNERYASMCSEVLIKFPLSATKEGCLLDFVKVSAARRSMRPMTGPGMGRPKNCCRASPPSCKANMMNIAINT